MSVICEICGREFKTPQGLRGHKTFVHNMRATHDTPANLAGEKEPDMDEEKLERLTVQIEQVEEALDMIVDKVYDQTGQINKLKVQLSGAQSADQKLSSGITRCRYDLGQLGIDLKRLSRFVQYEFAGVEDDIVWGIYLDSPELKSRPKLKKPK